VSTLHYDQEIQGMISISIIEKDGTQSNLSIPISLHAGFIHRISLSVNSLKLHIYNLLEYSISIICSDNNDTYNVFSRSYAMIEKPYHARMFLLQNQYGLLESFYIYNVLEEKNVEGDIVTLDRDEKIDISKKESIYTARTGSKRVTEMQLLKYAVEQQFNYIIEDNTIIPITILPDSWEISEEENDLQNAEFSFIATAGAYPLPGVGSGGLGGLRVVNTSPQSHEIVDINTEIVIGFNKEVVVLNDTDISIKDNDDNLVPGVHVLVLENEVRIEHEPLVLGKTYTVRIPADSFADLRDDIEWSFATIEALQLVEVVPSIDANNVLVTNTISALFNHPVTLLDANLVSVQTAAAETVSINVSVVDNSVLIEHEGLQADTFYSVEIGIGAIADFAEAISWEFQTMESLQVVMIKPSSDATEVNPEGDCFVVFSKTITAGNLSLVSLTDNDNNSIPVTPSINGNKLLIGSPTLEVNKSYTISVPMGSVYGYEHNILWSFATPVVVENTIVAFLPSQYAIDTALDAVISVEFS
jgi:hypothetical protein